MTSKKMTIGLKYCYLKHLGWPARHFMTNPIFSTVIGAYMDTRRSTRLIDGFIRANGIDMTDYVREPYRCFNDFFTRRIKDGAREIDYAPDVLISPCDGYLSAYRISEDAEFSIKNSWYNVDDLVGGASVADEYNNGVCLVLRLGVENYHRYCYIDDGFKSRNHHINGRYHPVQPIVVRKRPVFIQNTREYCILDTKNFGRVVQIEVGACLVGKIDNYREAGVTHRGEEKGLFRFGGSTIVLLFKENVLDIPQKLFEDTLRGKEYPVSFGGKICRKAQVK